MGATTDQGVMGWGEYCNHGNREVCVSLYVHSDGGQNSAKYEKGREENGKLEEQTSGATNGVDQNALIYHGCTVQR